MRRWSVRLVAVLALAVAAPVRAAPAVVEMPFTYGHGAIVVAARVGGETLSMMLDTGVDPSLVDLAVARRLGLPMEAGGSQGSGGGTDVNLAYGTTIPWISVGPLEVERLDAMAIDLSRNAAALGEPLDGVLGQSLLADRLVVIDYPQRVVRFHADRRTFDRELRTRSRHDRIVLPFRYADEILIDGVRVDGRPVTANLDTGSNASFQVTPGGAAALGVAPPDDPAAARVSIGINGATRNTVGTVPSIGLGGHVFARPPVVFYGAGTGHDHEAWSLRIGNAFLERFVVAIDYQRKRITLDTPLAKRPD